MARQISKISLVGKTFNSWTVLEEMDRKGRHRVWKCKCICGNIGFIRNFALFDNSSKRCKQCYTNTIKGFYYDYTDIIAPAIWNRVIRCANKRKIPFNITKNYATDIFLLQNKKCALSNLDINFPKNDSDRKKNSYTASLDRIDSSKWYEPDNIQWVHKDINIMKNIYSNNYFIYICKCIANNISQPVPAVFP